MIRFCFISSITLINRGRSICKLHIYQFFAYCIQFFLNCIYLCNVWRFLQVCAKIVPIMSLSLLAYFLNNNWSFNFMTTTIKNLQKIKSRPAAVCGNNLWKCWRQNRGVSLRLMKKNCFSNYTLKLCSIEQLSFFLFIVVFYVCYLFLL